MRSRGSRMQLLYWPHRREEINMLKFSRAASLAAAFASAASAQTVSFATLPPGSILHAQASVIAKVVQDHSKLQVRVNGYDGDAPILDAVNTQKADFLLLDVGEVADAYKGQGDWKGKPMPNLRTAITLYGSQMAFWVKKDSRIDSIAALKGRRVPSEWAQQTGVLPHTTALLNAGGITYNDVVKVPEVNVVRAADDFKAGKLDLLFFAVGAPKVAEVAAAVGGLRLLPADKLPDAERRMKKVRTEYYFSRVSPAPKSPPGCRLSTSSSRSAATSRTTSSTNSSRPCARTRRRWSKATRTSRASTKEPQANASRGCRSIRAPSSTSGKPLPSHAFHIAAHKVIAQRNEFRVGPEAAILRRLIQEEDGHDDQVAVREDLGDA